MNKDVDQSAGTLDVERATEHVVTVMNHAWLGLLLSVGERLGLNECLASEGPATVAEHAARAGVNERYLREWLWAMKAAGLVDVDTDLHGHRTFALKSAYRPALTKEGGPDHWSRITTQITAFARMENELLEAFRDGSGLPSDLYEGYVAEVLAGESGPIFRKALLSEVLPNIGMVNALERGIRVGDLGCGTGEAAILLAQSFPNSEFIGIDQSRTAISQANKEATRLGLNNVDFDVADLEHGIPVSSLNLIMAANTIHDLSNPDKFLKRVYQSLQPGGTVYLHELSASIDMEANVETEHALGILAFSLFHCLPLAKRQAGGMAPGGMWGRENYMNSLRKAGFTNIKLYNAPSDPNNDTITAQRSR